MDVAGKCFLYLSFHNDHIQENKWHSDVMNISTTMSENILSLV